MSWGSKRCGIDVDELGFELLFVDEPEVGSLCEGALSDGMLNIGPVGAGLPDGVGAADGVGVAAGTGVVDVGMG